MSKFIAAVLAAVFAMVTVTPVAFAGAHEKDAKKSEKKDEKKKDEKKKAEEKK